MGAKAGWITPMLHVRNVQRSIDFYRLIGFQLIDVEGCDTPGWARLHCDDGSAIMLLQAEEPENIDPEKQAIMLVLYTANLSEFREEMIASGVTMPKIEHPPWMPSGHVLFRDPDGYRVAVNHWSDNEHQAWLQQLEEKRAAGKLPSA
jgi:catechol 2,3-dioxygenase-like lactoylglutathione lyase family enzyme